MERSLLGGINGPRDLKKTKPYLLPQLCAEIRKQLIETVAQNGGHLASNLGAVELTVALHRVFNTPQDSFVFDVGHQSYVHKLLTGRRAAFSTLRQKGGLSGFPRASESPHDAFLGGHASTALSAAAGLARAKALRGDRSFTVAVVGDGAMTGGMVYEAMGTAAKQGDRLIVILNDNKMSISKNGSAIAKYLAEIRTRPQYFGARDSFESALGSLPIVGESAKIAAAKAKTAIKSALYKSNLFENFGFLYMGPLDGHNIQKLTEVLLRAKSLQKPVLIHVKTVKGKGFIQAENNPGAYHGVSPRAIDRGDPEINDEDNFSNTFGRALCRMADSNPRLYAITAAMKYGTGLQFFYKCHPERFIDVGIAEGHAVTYACGLAAGGMTPVFAVYSSFLQRCYDQLIHDASIDRRHIVLGIDRAGIVGEDGATHQGLFDVAMLSTIPGVSVYSPMNYRQLEADLGRAVSEHDGPVAVRYPRGCEDPLLRDFFDDGRGFVTSGEGDAAIVTYGRLLGEVLRAAQVLRGEGILAACYGITRILPLPEELIGALLQKKAVFFLEEGIRAGGIGMQLQAALLSAGYQGNYSCRAVDRFVESAKVAEALRDLGLDAEGIAAFVRGGLS